MPKIEPAGYPAHRALWQTGPQAFLRFYHVPSSEVLIATAADTFFLFGEENATDPAMKGIHLGTENGDYEHAQSILFRNPLRANATLTLELVLQRVGNPTGNLIIEIRTDAGGVPSSTVIGNGTQTILASSISTAVGGVWRAFTWPDPLNRPGVVTNARYWLVIRGEWPVSATNHVRIARQPASSYGDGDDAWNTQAAATTWALHTPGDLLFRFTETVTSLSGVLPTAYPFSRDFRSDAIVTDPQRPSLDAIESIGGATQTVDPPNATSSVGVLTVTLTDLSGELVAQCSSLPLPVFAMTPSTPGPGQFLSFNTTAANVAGLPALGTLAILTAGVIERVRYDQRDSVLGRVRVLARGVDGTVAAAHALNDLAANGEELRQGQRAVLFLGYTGVSQGGYLQYGTWEVIGRTFAGASVRLTLADMQRHLVKTVFLNASPDAPYTVRGHPIDMALSFLMSTGTGINGSYDRFAADAGLGLPEGFIDIAAFQALGAVLPAGETWDFRITGPTEGKAFFEEQILRALACYPFIDQFGRYSVRRFQTAPDPGSVAEQLTEDDVIDFTGPSDGPVLNQAVVEMDFDLPSRPHEFGKRTIYSLPESIAVFGRKPPWTMRHYGLRTADGGDVTIEQTLLALAQRYGTTTAPPLLEVTIPYRRHNLEQGDRVRLSHSQIPNPISGRRGISNAVCEIQDLTPRFLARPGGLTLKLLYVGGIPTLTGGWTGLPISLGPALPPPPSGLEVVNNGVGQGNDTSFAGPDVAVQWNTVGPIAGQELTGAEPTGPWDVAYYAVEVYTARVVALDGPGTAGEWMLRRAVQVADNHTSYPYAANNEDHRTMPQRQIMGRWWTVLRDGRRSEIYSELIVLNPAPTMAGFVVTVTLITGGVEGNWAAWPQTDPDLERFEILYASSVDADWSPGMVPNKSYGFVGKDTTSGSVVGLPPGTTFRGMLVPHDVFGAGIASEIFEVTIPTAPGTGDVTPPAVPTGLALSTGFMVDPGPDGSYRAYIEATWTRNTDDTHTYVLRGKRATDTPWSNWIDVPQTASGNPVIRQTVLAGELVDVQVAARDQAGNLSAFCATVQITVATPSLSAVPTGLALSTGVETVAAPDGSYRVWVQATCLRNTDTTAVYVFRARRTGAPEWTYALEVPQPAAGNPVTRQTVLPGDAIDVQVAARDQAGRSSAFSATVAITAAIPPVVAVPAGLALSTGVETAPSQDGTYRAWVQATWTRNTDATFAYRLRARRQGAAEWTYALEVPQPAAGNPTVRDFALAGDLLEVQVAGLDQAGVSSAFSASATVTVATMTTPPAAPTGAFAEAGAKAVYLRWNRVDDPSLSHYEVHEGTTAGFAITGSGEMYVGTCIAHTGGATYTRTFDATMQYPITRYYRVVAVRVGTLRSAPSGDTGVTVTGYDTVAPGTPTGLALSTGVDAAPAADGSYTAWVEATCARNAEGDMLSYIFRGRRSGDTAWQEYPVAQPTSGAPVLRVRGIISGATIEVQVSAVDGDGNRSAFTGTSSIAAAAFTTAPAQVVGLQIGNGAKTVWAVWAPVTIPDLDHYEYHLSTTPGFTPTGTTPGVGTCAGWAAGASHTFAFGAGQQYPVTVYVRVRAVRISGVAGAFSTEATTTVTGYDTVAPGTPTGLALSTGVDAAPAADGSYTAWVEATCARNAEGDMLSYIFRGRRSGDTAWQEYPVRQPASGAPVLRVRGIIPGATIEVQVAAVDGDGNSSAFTATSSLAAATFTTAPATVTGVTAQAVALGVFLKWDPVAIPDLDHYEVHESQTNGFTATGTTPASGTCLAWVSATQYTRRVDVSGAGLTAYYRVIAVRTSGARGAQSAQAGATIPRVVTDEVTNYAITEAVGEAYSTTDQPLTTTGTVSVFSAGSATYDPTRLYDFDGLIHVENYGGDVTATITLFIGNASQGNISNEFTYATIPVGIIFPIRVRAAQRTLSGSVNLNLWAAASVASKLRVLDTLARWTVHKK